MRQLWPVRGQGKTLGGTSFSSEKPGSPVVIGLPLLSYPRLR